MENAKIAALLKPADIYGRPRTVLQQKIRKRVHFGFLPEEFSRKGARYTAILIGEQAEQLALIEQAQEFAGSAGVHPVAPAIDRPNFLVQYAIEPSRLYRNVACHKRHAQTTEPRANCLVVPVMCRKENAPIPHFLENRSSSIRKSELHTVARTGERCGIGGQLFVCRKTEKQIPRMARHIGQKPSIKQASLFMRNRC